MKNRTLIGIVCIVLALALVFGGSALVNVIQTKTVYVIAADSYVQKGEKISAAKLKVLEVNEGSVMANSIKYKNEEEAQDALIKMGQSGLYSTVDILEGDFISEKKYTTNSTNIDAALEALDGSKIAISIPLSSFAGHLSGKLQSGDVVSLVVSSKNTKETTIPQAFRYLQVIALTTSGGVDEENVVRNTDGSYAMPSTVTFILNPTQAAMLRALLASGDQVYLTLAFRGSDDDAQKFIKVTDDYMAGVEQTAMQLAKQRINALTTDSKEFNKYYEEHKVEFLNIVDSVFEEIFGMHILTDMSDSAYVETNNEETVSDVAASDTPVSEEASTNG